MSDLAKALVIDFAELGMAVQESDSVLRSLDGANQVELETVNDELGNAAALNIFVNGDLVETVSYEDSSFNEKLIKIIAEPLNF